MAGIAFKQPCPSCEHPIPIRDVALVGKKVECPKCKYRFVVQKPKPVDQEEVEAEAPPPTKGSKPAAAAKPKAKAGALRHAEEDDLETAPAKSGSRKKMYIGLGLAGVGLVVLVLASFVILGKPSNNSVKKGLPVVPIVQQKGAPDPDDDPKEGDKEPEKKDVKEEEPKVAEKPPAPKEVIEDVLLTPPGPELTNLLPNDAEHVFHGFFKEVFDVLSPFRGPIAGDSRALTDAAFKPRLGFAVAEIDDLIRADRFSRTPWTFTVIHLKNAIDESAVTAAFGLKRMPTVRGHEYFKATKSNPWFDQLSHVAVGVPQWLRVIGRGDSPPLFVRFHNRQTLIFANDVPLQELLKNDLQFPLMGRKTAAAPREAGKLDNDKKDDEANRNGGEKKPDVKPAFGAGPPAGRGESYLTVKPKLKEVLDRLESKTDLAAVKLYFSTATELEPARVSANSLPPDERGKLIWRGKQIWDLASLLEERRPRITFAGSALVQRDGRGFQYRAEFDCTEEKEALNILKYSDDVIAPEFARNFERYLQHKIELSKAEPPPPPTAVGIAPAPPKEVSRWDASQRDNCVDVKIDLVLDNATLGRIRTLTSLFAMAARAEVEVVSDTRGRHALGKGAIAMAEQGRPDRQIPAGSFPPGTLKRPGAVARTANVPYQRLSWMTMLLPYLGHDSLYDRIDFASSWRDPVNWLPARTIVPEFLDGSYPDAARFVPNAGIGVAPAATHIVGIAGVGHDAAEYPRDDPAFADKRGVFGYERSATLADLQKGHGASSTIIMMQIPHDGITGVSPWIAGGGSTVRGVPEKNSLAPFVLSNDKNGKPIDYKGQRGTYVIMGDNSVRFLNANTPDEIVKALCTVQGPGPKTDFFGDEHFPLVPDPAAAKPSPSPKVAAAPKVVSAAAQPKVEVAPLPKKTEMIDDAKK